MALAASALTLYVPTLLPGIGSGDTAATAVAASTVVAMTLLPNQAGAVATGTPPTVTAADIHFTQKLLSYGSPSSAGLVPQPIDRIATDIASYLRPSPTHPEYAGAVALAAHDGVVVANDAAGYALRYADDTPTELPPDQWIPMRGDTIFDLASMTKLFTAIAAVMPLLPAGMSGRHFKMFAI